eukprot:24425-Pyramimonas_sp.AAC.1
MAMVMAMVGGMGFLHYNMTPRSRIPLRAWLLPSLQPPSWREDKAQSLVSSLHAGGGPGGKHQAGEGAQARLRAAALRTFILHADCPTPPR